METINGSLLQRNISKVFPSKIAAQSVELLFLFLIGMLAITLHAKLRIPMHLPGKQGLIFMLFIILARSSSSYSFAASLTCLGASSLLFLNIFGFDDPFMPLVYIFIGIVMDLLFGFASKLPAKALIIGLASGLSWMAIPLFRILISNLTGFPYLSLAGGLAFPLFTHFTFGFLGGYIGFNLVRIFNKNTK